MHTNKIPLYEKIYHDLREKIQTNYYKAGEIIPTEQELMNLYHVSRVTVRKATDRLVEADLLTRKPGYGTVVKERFFTNKTVEYRGFNEEMKSHGRAASTKVTAFSIICCDNCLASILGIEPNDQVYHFIRHRYGDGILLQIEESYMPVKIFTDLSIQWLENSKFDYIRKCGYTIDFAMHLTTPILPDTETAAKFDLDPLTPIIKINNTTFTIEGMVIDYTEQYLNSPKYQLQYMKKK